MSRRETNETNKQNKNTKLYCQQLQTNRNRFCLTTTHSTPKASKQASKHNMSASFDLKFTQRTASRPNAAIAFVARVVRESHNRTVASCANETRATCFLTSFYIFRNACQNAKLRSYVRARSEQCQSEFEVQRRHRVAVTEQQLRASKAHNEYVVRVKGER